MFTSFNQKKNRRALCLVGHKRYGGMVGPEE